MSGDPGLRERASMWRFSVDLSSNRGPYGVVSNCRTSPNVPVISAKSYAEAA